MKLFFCSVPRVQVELHGRNRAGEYGHLGLFGSVPTAAASSSALSNNQGSAPSATATAVAPRGCGVGGCGSSFQSVLHSRFHYGVWSVGIGRERAIITLQPTAIIARPPLSTLVGVGSCRRRTEGNVGAVCRRPGQGSERHSVGNGFTLQSRFPAGRCLCDLVSDSPFLKDAPLAFFLTTSVR